MVRNRQKWSKINFIKNRTLVRLGQIHFQTYVQKLLTENFTVQYIEIDTQLIEYKRRSKTDTTKKADQF